jgi:hypothetical protein
LWCTQVRSSSSSTSASTNSSSSSSQSSAAFSMSLMRYTQPYPARQQQFTCLSALLLAPA